jgi:hypothetical protein
LALLRAGLGILIIGDKKEIFPSPIKVQNYQKASRKREAFLLPLLLLLLLQLLPAIGYWLLPAACSLLTVFGGLQ